MLEFSTLQKNLVRFANEVLNGGKLVSDARDDPFRELQTAAQRSKLLPEYG